MKAQTHLDVVTKKVSSSAVDATPAKPKSMPKSTPLRFRAPSVNIDAPLIPVGLGSDGAIAMPDAFDVAGWYANAPTPGELGPSVIVGHVDQVGGIAIFWRIRYLQPGDTVYVDREDGPTAAFKVNDIENYSQDDFPTNLVYGNTEFASIRVITCGGTFNTATHHYSDNTVVYGTLE